MIQEFNGRLLHNSDHIYKETTNFLSHLSPSLSNALTSQRTKLIHTLEALQSLPTHEFKTAIKLLQTLSYISVQNWFAWSRIRITTLLNRAKIAHKLLFNSYRKSTCYTCMLCVITNWMLTKFKLVSCSRQLR